MSIYQGPCTHPKAKPTPSASVLHCEGCTATKSPVDGKWRVLEDR